MTHQRVHLLISGRVQGVWYRASTQREAARLGLVGWVRNLPDGRVEAVAEGPPDQLDALVDWCHEGPRDARVTGVTVERLPPQGDLAGFEVLR
ncbi:MAG: acylphosphatase [Alphaproteobacteria bacterium]|nr:acylphosphatase [Alphaproteobacteria bacterium]